MGYFSIQINETMARALQPFSIATIFYRKMNAKFQTHTMHAFPSVESAYSLCGGGLRCGIGLRAVVVVRKQFLRILYIIVKDFLVASFHSFLPFIVSFFFFILTNKSGCPFHIH